MSSSRKHPAPRQRQSGSSAGPSAKPGRGVTSANPPLRPSSVVVGLSALIAVLGIAASGAGLFWSDAGRAFPFTTLRGQTVQMFGHGIYRYDTLFLGSGNQGTDAVTLFLGVPLLLVFTALYRRGSQRGGLLLSGMLTYFLYVYASLALSAAYNPLFLAYVAILSASFYALALALMSFDARVISERYVASLPRRGPAAFFFVSGALTTFVWLVPLVSATLAGQPPKLLDSYTTMVTYALDLALIVPTCFVAGRLILRGAALGYLIAFPLLVLVVMLAPAIAAQTYSQLSAGITFTPGEAIGPIAGFVTLGLLAVWVIVVLLRPFAESASEQATLPARAAR